MRTVILVLAAAATLPLMAGCNDRTPGNESSMAAPQKLPVTAAPDTAPANKPPAY